MPNCKTHQTPPWTATLPWTLPTGGGLVGAVEAVTICFASGVCETVITVGGVVVGTAGMMYILARAKPVYPYEHDWRKQRQFQCGKLNLPRKSTNKEACDEMYETNLAICRRLAYSTLLQ